MTETDWIASDDVRQMLRKIGKGAFISATKDSPAVDVGITDRQLRLFACGCCRQVNGLTDPRSRRAVEVAERFADGEATGPELEQSFLAAVDAGSSLQDGSSRVIAATAAHAAQHPLRISPRPLHVPGVPELPPALQAALLRDIAGNPWRSVPLPKCGRCNGDGKARGSDRPFEWTSEVGYPGPCPTCDGFGDTWICRTRTVLAIAGLIYGEVKACNNRRGVMNDQLYPRSWRLRAPFDASLLPLLADALEEAGCCDADVLNHCRGMERCWCFAGVGTQGQQRLNYPCDRCHEGGWIPLRSPHVRGCWIIDMILQKP